jgi:hypothetical protein
MRSRSWLFFAAFAFAFAVGAAVVLAQTELRRNVGSAW